MEIGPLLKVSFESMKKPGIKLTTPGLQVRGFSNLPWRILQNLRINDEVDPRFLNIIFDGKSQISQSLLSALG